MKEVVGEGSRLGVGLALAFLAVWPLLLFPEVAAGREAFAFGDNGYINYRTKALVARELAEGSLPVWSRFPACGFPILGESQTGVFYPPHLLSLWLLPVKWAFNLNVLGHMVLAAWGAFFLCRRLGTGLGPATFAGSVIVLTGGYTNSLQMIQALEAQSYIPWAFIAIDALCRLPLRRALGAAAVLGGLLALQVVAGYAQHAYYTFLAAVVYVSLRAWRRGWLLGVAGGVSGLLAAVQVLPTLEHLRLTTRSEIRQPYPATPDLPMLAEAWRSFLPHFQAGAQSEWSKGFVGLALAGLSVMAVLTLPRRRVLPLAGVALLALSITGIYPPLFGHLLNVLPGLRYFRNHQRVLALFGFAVVVLAALGLSRLAQGVAAGSAMRRSMVRLVAGTLIAAGVGLAIQAGRDGAPVLLIWALAALFTGALGMGPGRFRSGLVGLVALASLAELGVMFGNVTCTRPASFVEEVTPVGEWLEKHLGMHRVHFEPMPATPIAGTPGKAPGRKKMDQWTLRLDRVMTTRAVTSFTVQRYGWTMNHLSTLRPRGPRRFRGDPALLGIANVRYVVTWRPVEDPDLVKPPDGPAGPPFLWENRGFLPRAFFVARARLVEGELGREMAALAELEDPGGTILVHEEGAQMDGGRPGLGGDRRDRLRFAARSHAGRIGRSRLRLLRGEGLPGLERDRGWSSSGAAASQRGVHGRPGPGRRALDRAPVLAAATDGGAGPGGDRSGGPARASLVRRSTLVRFRGRAAVRFSVSP